MENSRCSVSACRIKCVLNTNIGNMKDTFSKIWQDNHTEIAHYEIMNVKYNMWYKYKIVISKSTLWIISGVVGIKSWVKF